MGEPEYFLNTRENRVVPANPVMVAYAANKAHLVPCDAEGNKVGDTGKNEETAPLKRKLAELESERDLLREEVARLKGTEDPLKKEASGGEEPQAPAEDTVNKIDALVEAISDLQDGHPDHFTGGGLPKVEALEVMSGFQDVSSAERDEAWAKYNEEKD